MYSLGILYSHYLNDGVKSKEYLNHALQVPNIPADLKEAIEREIAHDH